MSIEKRDGTRQQYVTKVTRVGDRLRKRYIGPASDPMVDLLTRTEQLDKARHAAIQKELQNEIEASRMLEALIDRLAKSTADWKVLSRLCELSLSKSLKSKKSKMTSVQLPGLHRFREICELANRGDNDAKKRLEEWVSAAPSLLRDATDLVAMARKHLVEFMGGEDAESIALLGETMDQRSKAIWDLTSGDPLGKLFADMLVVAWMDAMRCQVGTMRPINETKTAKYWEAAADRAQKRVFQINKAFDQHLKESQRAARKT